MIHLKNASTQRFSLKTSTAAMEPRHLKVNVAD